jgi:hypothetical protein
VSELRHLSYSSIESYSSCARNYEFQKVKKLPRRNAAALVTGRAVHETLQESIRQRVHGGLPDFDSTRTLLTERWTRQLEAEPVDDWQGKSEAYEFERAAEIVAQPGFLELVYAIEPMIGDDGEPMIERKINLKLPGVETPVIGFIDLIGRDGVPYDFKTASKDWTEAKARGERQPLYYLAALGQERWPHNKALKFRYIVFTKGKPDGRKPRPPSIAQFEVQASPAGLFWAVRAAAEAHRGITAGVFPPNPASWKCSARFCDYWNLCVGKFSTPVADEEGLPF